MKKKYPIIIALLAFINIIGVPSPVEAEVLSADQTLAYTDSHDWQKQSKTGILSLTIGKNDKAIQEWAQSVRTPISDKVSRTVKQLGDLHFTMPVLGALYVYGRDQGNERLQRTASDSSRAAAATALISGVIKKAVHRDRPNNQDDKSFPSHHAASSFTIATVVASEYGGGTGAYGLAGMTALSRINDNEHWATDVLFGSALGYFVGKSTSR